MVKKNAQKHSERKFSSMQKTSRILLVFYKEKQQLDFFVTLPACRQVCVTFFRI